MDKPLEITFRNLDRSEAVVTAIEEKCHKLERFYNHIIDMHVTIEAPHKHHRHGQHYRADIEVVVPGKRLVANHSSDKNARHEMLIPTIDDAFKSIGRQLEDYARMQRGTVKHHEAPAAEPDEQEG